jgi:cell division protein FtsN
MARSGRRGATRKTGVSASSSRSGWLWLIGGLLLGAALSYGVYVAHEKWTARQQAMSAEAGKDARTKGKPAPAAKDAKTAEAKDRRFEFYTLLPEMEVHITDDKFKEALRAPPKPAESETYILQVGSFRRVEEADGMKARLALLGVEATIQTVVIRDNDVWYRVRVGPYGNLKEVSEVSARLRKNDIDFMLLRLG